MHISSQTPPTSCSRIMPAAARTRQTAHIRGAFTSKPVHSVEKIRNPHRKMNQLVQLHNVQVPRQKQLYSSNIACRLHLHQDTNIHIANTSATTDSNADQCSLSMARKSRIYPTHTCQAKPSNKRSPNRQHTTLNTCLHKNQKVINIIQAKGNIFKQVINISPCFPVNCTCIY